MTGVIGEHRWMVVWTVAANGKAALVVDDVVSFDPWIVRMVEIRGTADALTGVDRSSPGPAPDGAVIRRS